MKYVFNIKHNTPTTDLKKLIIQALAGQSVNATIAYMRVKDSNGNILGSAQVTSSDWSNYTVTKNITITTAGSATKFTLENSDGVELYVYELSSPLQLNANDVVSITWSISKQTGTNMNDVGNEILDFIIGNVTSIKIAKVAFYYQGAEQVSQTQLNVTADTTNLKVTITGSVSPSSNVSYDSIWIFDENGMLLFNISASGQLASNVTTNFTIEITLE